MHTVAAAECLCSHCSGRTVSGSTGPALSQTLRASKGLQHSTEVHRVTCRHRSASPTATAQTFTGSHVAIAVRHPLRPQTTGPRAPGRPVSMILITVLQPAMAHPLTTPYLGRQCDCCSLVTWEESPPSARECSSQGSCSETAVVHSLLLMEAARILFISVMWQKGDSCGQRAWVCFPAPCLAILRTSVGKGCSSAFCCTYFN